MKKILVILGFLIFASNMALANNFAYVKVTTTVSTSNTITANYPLWTYISGSTLASSKHKIIETSGTYKMQVMFPDSAADSINGAYLYIGIPAATTLENEMLTANKGVYVRLTGSGMTSTFQYISFKPVPINPRDF
jgi:hypothetical protein